MGDALTAGSEWFEDFAGNLLFLYLLMKVPDSSEP
jgi:hypothetical protein